MDESSVIRCAESELEYMGRMVCVLVPTTRATAEALAGWETRWPDLHVVAPMLNDAMTPSHLLELLRSGHLPDRIAVFLDQLVSATHAPVPVRHEQVVRYHSGLECVLPLQYGYRQVCAISPADNPNAIRDLPSGFAFARRHLERCARLGDAWALRASQADATLPARAQAARRRMRYLESAILHAGTWTNVRNSAAALARLRDAHKHLRLSTQEAAHVT